jgi:PadR family transcriptional regulator, regulatory protein PadR
MAPFDTKAALLQALVEGEGYGLELIDRVKEMTGGELVLMQGRVYPALRELEAAGFATSFDGPALRERSGRPRRYYRITAAGQAAARQQARAVYRLLKPSLGEAR